MALTYDHIGVEQEYDSCVDDFFHLLDSEAVNIAFFIDHSMKLIEKTSLLIF
jgi:hypothetical protein